MYLTQGLHRAVQRQPDVIALRHLGEGGVRSMGHAELADSVARHAAALLARGIAAGDRIAMLSPNSDALIVQLLAAWWLGAVACPLNLRWSLPELRHALADSGARLLLVDPGLLDLAGPLADTTTLLPGPALAAESRAARPIADTRTGGDALAAILYTGGTTGRAKGVLAAITTHRVSDIIVVPSMLQALLDDPGFDAGRLQSLKRIAFGAAPMPPDLLKRALAAWPTAEFFQAYGMTETAAAVCINLPANHRPADPSDPRAQAVLRSVGRAGLGAEIRIADEQGQDLPRGEVGEILLRGPMVMRGYWNQPEATAQALRDGWLHSGDAGRLDDQGYLFIVDRLKDMVISGGENVYSAEVEAALRSHPAVADAAVIGLPDERWGEAVHAVVVLRPGIHLDAIALRDHCRTQLAGYKCPRSVSFMAALPLSASGKVLKTVLRQSLANAATTEPAPTVNPEPST